MQSSMTDATIYKAFGRTVAARRRVLDLTQMELAARSGLSRASIASIENGRQSVLLHHVYELASALKMEKVADLLPPQPKSDGGNMLISDETVTASGKAQIEDLVASALARRAAKAST